ncbi:acyl carrier protein [Anatilimnocola sp. NA78]|uniref:acyl carrier protein n=1 Tax=Anatilimnocola sp. NA78 TaxID=3415683 RepID=UPI003CE57AE1
MDRATLRATLLDLMQQETWESFENVSDDVNLRTGLKLDSVDLLSMALHAERKLGIAIQSQDFANVNTLGDLLDMLTAKLATKQHSRAA